MIGRHAAWLLQNAFAVDDGCNDELILSKLIRRINSRSKITTAAATEPGIRFWQHN